MQLCCIFIFDNFRKISQFVNAFINQNLVIVIAFDELTAPEFAPK